jgi:serine/threonine protein kinase/tetratricopeptide (TPR) repeat protein
MEEESIFSLGPEQLNRLLSIGTEDDLQQEEKQKANSKDQSTKTSSPLSEIMEQPGGWIDRYQLLSVLGEGGMGIVYLAEQKEPIRRQVALKVIKPGMDSKRVIARFESERQALALLDHPNIAHVYDAGTTQTSRPYFVMEYVKGLSITDYCDRHKLTIEDRLNLFMLICQAVHHAHQKGIIHRDIKPSNILVSTENDRAIPKIIDFGVAKAMAQPLTERTLETEGSQLLCTPEYMSPEQADMAVEDIDIRSDIYSLGVLLYVLLTGVLPFDSTTFREGGIEHIRQVIRETDPKTPSIRLSSLGEEAKKIAQSRQTEVATLTKYLRKELEWIPLKAMRKKRTERYRSASELADDIQNYLSGAALIAGPPSTIYRVKKFVRRHKAFVTGIAAVVAVLITGVVVSTIFAVRVERQARTSQAIIDFLSNDMLASVDPLTGEQPGASLESWLAVASQRLEGKFKHKPLIEASIRYRIGRTYWHLGRYKAGETNLKRAAELRRETVGTDDREILMYLQELAWVYWYQSRLDEAEPLLTEAVAGMRRLLSEVDPILLKAINRLGWVYQSQGRYEEAEKLQAEALEVVQHRLGHEHPYVTGHMEGLALAYWRQGRLEAAEELCRKALDISRRVNGEEHYATLGYTANLGQLCRALGRHGEAEELLVKALKAWRRLVGKEHFKTLTVMRQLGSLYRELERYDEAEQLLLPVLEANRRLYGEEDQKTLHSMFEVAELYRDQGHYGKAEHVLLNAEQTSHRVFGNDHEITNSSVKSLIKLYEVWNKPEKAEKWRAKLPRTEVVEQ